VAEPVMGNIPWEERPKGSTELVWRSARNPILTSSAVPGARSVFNSAVAPFGNGFAGVFRCDNSAWMMNLHRGFSPDGVRWSVDPQPITWICEDEEIARLEYRYDPRVVWMDDRYHITWCNGYHGPTIGVGYTFDFARFYQGENAFLPYNRNGVLFPRKIHGNYAMLSRPSDRGHTPFGDIFYSESPDLVHWGRHRFVMAPAPGWQSTKVGPGPAPLETDEGWLLFYHGVITQCNGFVYSMGAALLDRDEPWKVLFRTRSTLLTPHADYERSGDTPNVVFPCGLLQEGPTGRLAIYYGAADTVIGLAFAHLEEILDFVKRDGA